MKYLLADLLMLILTIFEFILVSSSIASSCFLFSGSSVSSFLYFLLLLRNGAKREREKVLGAIFFFINVTQFLCLMSLQCLYFVTRNHILVRNCVHIM